MAANGVSLMTGENGALQHVAWPGGYAITHYCADGEPLCRECADATHADSDCDWKPVHSDVYWEGPPIQCANCYILILSEYGEGGE